jgi:hypothetical protein
MVVELMGSRCALTFSHALNKLKLPIKGPELAQHSMR